MEKREQFTFYRSFYEALQTLPKKERLTAYEAVISYALDGETQALSGAAQCAFLLIRPILDTARRNAQNARRRSGKSNEKTASETEAKPERTTSEPGAKSQRTTSEPAAKSKKEKEIEIEDKVENEVEGEIEKENKNHAVATGEGDGKKAPAGGRADAADAAADADGVVRAYLQRVNPHATPGCLNELRGFVATVGADCCLRAIDTALDEKHTAWSYIRAILRSKEAKGVRSLADWDADERRRAGDGPGTYRQNGENRPQGSDLLQGNYRQNGDCSAQGNYRQNGDCLPQGNDLQNGNCPPQGDYRQSGEYSAQGNYRQNGEYRRQGGYPSQRNGQYQRHGDPLSPLARRAVQRALAECDS